MYKSVRIAFMEGRHGATNSPVTYEPLLNVFPSSLAGLLFKRRASEKGLCGLAGLSKGLQNTRAEDFVGPFTGAGGQGQKELRNVASPVRAYPSQVDQIDFSFGSNQHVAHVQVGVPDASSPEIGEELAEGAGYPLACRGPRPGLGEKLGKRYAVGQLLLDQLPGSGATAYA
jgi:hypothetical protein